MKVSENNNAYRRGMLLGLTMAEIIILIIFLLLLAFATMLERVEEKNAAISAVLGKDSAVVEKIVQIIASSPDDSDEIIRILENAPKVVEMIRKAELRKETEKSSSEVIERALNRLVTEKSKSVDGESLSAEELLEIEKEKSSVLENKVTVLEEKVREGSGPPPCWDTGNRKYSEFIFQADLRSDGIILSDISSEKWATSKATLPISTILLGKRLSQSEFSSQTNALWHWSLKNDCRFLVRVTDQTLEHEKEVYKAMHQTIENHFMIADVKRRRNDAIRSSKASLPVNNSGQSDTPRKKKSFFGELFAPSKEKTIYNYNN